MSRLFVMQKTVNDKTISGKLQCKRAHIATWKATDYIATGGLSRNKADIKTKIEYLSSVIFLYKAMAVRLLRADGCLACHSAVCQLT